MRILHVITGLGLGGAENALLGLCRDMMERGDAIAVCSLGAGSDLLQEFRDSGIDVEVVGLAGITKMIAGLRAKVARFDPDVIHCWMYHPLLTAPLFARGKPIVAGIRASLESLQTEKWLTKAIVHLCAISSRWATYIVYNSERAAAQHESIGYLSARRRIIPNGFDLDRIGPDPDRRTTGRIGLGIAEDEFVIGHAGRFHAVKNQVGLIQASAILRDRGRRLRLVLAGTGVSPLNQILKHAIETAGFADEVMLLGPVQPVTDLLCMCDMFANVSIGESFPNVVAEAMATALPVVTTDAGESSVIVGDAGLVIAGHSPREIADGIQKILDMPGSQRRSLGILARNRIANLFSRKSVTRAYVELYEHAVQHHESRR